MLHSFIKSIFGFVCSLFDCIESAASAPSASFLMKTICQTPKLQCVRVCFYFHPFLFYYDYNSKTMRTRVLSVIFPGNSFKIAILLPEMMPQTHFALHIILPSARSFVLNYR